MQLRTAAARQRSAGLPGQACCQKPGAEMAAEALMLCRPQSCQSKVQRPGQRRKVSCRGGDLSNSFSLHEGAQLAAFDLRLTPCSASSFAEAASRAFRPPPFRLFRLFLIFFAWLAFSSRPPAACLSPSRPDAVQIFRCRFHSFAAAMPAAGSG